MSAVATILTIGDELLSGASSDTNGPWLSDQLLSFGMKTVRRSVVGDQASEIAKAINELAAQSDMLLITGGLGPTADDRTRQGLALAMGVELECDDSALQSIQAWFNQKNIEMPSPNVSQANVPQGCTWIQNTRGIAPGIHAMCSECHVYCLPGPPIELMEMFSTVSKEFEGNLQTGSKMYSVKVHSWGMPESIAGSLIHEFMEGDDSCVTVLMSDNGITAIVNSQDKDQLEQVVAEVKKRWTPWEYGQEGTSLAQAVSVLAIRDGLTIATAESCTGGLLSDAIVREAGSSEWFVGGFVTYTNKMKQMQLGVEEELIEQYGAVSAQVASAMCQGVCQMTNAELGISITGVAGPTGGTEEKPVGTVWIACSFQGEVKAKQFCFSGTRNQIRRRASQSALQMLRLQLLQVDEQEMCWQLGDPLGVS